MKKLVPGTKTQEMSAIWCCVVSFVLLIGNKTLRVLGEIHSKDKLGSGSKSQSS